MVQDAESGSGSKEHEEKEKCGDGMDRARLESIRGFFVYVSRTYQYMNS